MRSKNYFPNDTHYRKRVASSSGITIDENVALASNTVYNDNFILDAIPDEYFEDGLDNVALLNDGKKHCHQRHPH